VQSQIENAVNSVVEVVIFNFKKNKIYFNQIKKKEIIKPRSVSLFFAFTIHNRSKQCQIFARPSLTKEKLTTRATQSKTKIRICSFFFQQQQLLLLLLITATTEFSFIP